MSIWTCEEHGDECVVCFTKKDRCPFCALQREREDFESDIDQLKSQVDSLTDKVMDLEAERDHLKSELDEKNAQ